MPGETSPRPKCKKCGQTIPTWKPILHGGYCSPKCRNKDGKNYMKALAAQAPLAALADEINREHAAAGAALRTTLEHARNAGEKLIKAKELCEHGNWLEWVDKNLKCSARTVQDYMRIAKDWDKLPDPNTRPVAYLGLREALASLAETTEKPSREHRPERSEQQPASGENAPDIQEEASPSRKPEAKASARVGRVVHQDAPGQAPAVVVVDPIRVEVSEPKPGPLPGTRNTATTAMDRAKEAFLALAAEERGQFIDWATRVAPDSP